MVIRARIRAGRDDGAPPVSLFDLLKFLPLFVGKIDRDLACALPS